MLSPSLTASPSPLTSGMTSNFVGRLFGASEKSSALILPSSSTIFGASAGGSTFLPSGPVSVGSPASTRSKTNDEVVVGLEPDLVGALAAVDRSRPASTSTTRLPTVDAADRVL